MAFELPRLPLVGLEPEAFQIYWQKVVEAIEAHEANQDVLLAAVAAMFDDNTLTPVEKPTWILFNSFLTGEQAGLDAQATASGITTEKTAYDAAQTALAAYLATLTTDVAWNDLSGNTSIVGTTLRSKFNDVLATKQALINKVVGNVRLTDKISASWTSPGTILSASDAGSSATITISAHTRKYGDTTSVSVNGGSVTGLAYSTKYYVYYDDPNTAGGAVTYHADANPNVAEYNAASGRHYCGSITTPASGAGSTSGGVTPGGGGYSGPGEIP
jgi:hypothetical protein